ncbi:MAG: futalosine hydrolase [Planctomycetota bacterium]
MDADVEVPLGVLWVVAVAAEAEAVLRGLGSGVAVPEPWRPTLVAPEHALIVSGVGKSGAAGASALAVGWAQPALVVSAGVAGALGGELEIGSVVVGTESIEADEGVRTADGFIPVSELGFGPALDGGSRFASPPELVEDLLEIGFRAGTIATVSSGSGSDAARDEIVARTGAIAEAMEGAAVLRAAAWLGLPAVEVRAISNTTGHRAAQHWDLPLALDRLSSGVLACSPVFERYARGRQVRERPGADPRHGS